MASFWVTGKEAFLKRPKRWSKKFDHFRCFQKLSIYVLKRVGLKTCLASVHMMALFRVAELRNCVRTKLNVLGSHCYFDDVLAIYWSFSCLITTASCGGIWCIRLMRRFPIRGRCGRISPLILLERSIRSSWGYFSTIWHTLPTYWYFSNAPKHQYTCRRGLKQSVQEFFWELLAVLMFGARESTAECASR